MPTSKPRRHRSACALILPLMALGAISTPLAGQTAPNHLYDTFRVGAYLSGISLGSTVRIDGGEGQGTEVDAEDDLGLARTKFQPRFALRWRPGRRHELEVGYQFARRSGEKVITKDFEYGDTTFTAGLRVRSEFETDQAFLNYRFAIMAKEKTQLGLAVGLGAVLLGTSIDALAGIASGSEADSVAYTASGDFTGPTASLGGYGRFVLGTSWYLEADLRAVKVAIDRIDASVVEGGLAVNYFISSKWGVEAGYGVSSIKVDVGQKPTSDPGTTGRVTYSLQHLRLGVVFVP